MQHVGSTLLDGKGAPSMTVTTGGIDKEHINRLHGREIIFGFLAHHIGMRQTQQRQIMTGEPTERCGVFHIGSSAKVFSHEREIDTQTACKVNMMSLDRLLVKDL